MVSALAAILLAAHPAPDWKRVFQGYEACFYAQELGSGRTVEYNPARANKRFPPCSTYKIPHSVLALDAGVVRPDEVFRWDGKPQRISGWEKDFNLEGAIKASAVWVFEVIAHRLGKPRSELYLKRLNYGNRDASGYPLAYWLMSSLKVSAKEQVVLLAGLVRESWPVSKSAQSQVKSWLLVEEGPGYRYFGKTGSGIEGWKGGHPPNAQPPTPNAPSQLGWWVGWIEGGEQTWVFAANYRGKDAMGIRLRPKLRPAFVQLGWLPPPSTESPGTTFR